MKYAADFLRSLVKRWREKDQELYLQLLLVVFLFFVLFVISSHWLVKTALIILSVFGFLHFKIKRDTILSIISLFVVILALGHDQSSQETSAEISDKLYKFEHDSFEIIHRPYLYPEQTKIDLQVLGTFRPTSTDLEPKMAFSHGLVNLGQTPAIITDINIVAGRNQEFVKKGEGVQFEVDEQSPIPALQSDDRQGKSITIHTRNVFINLSDMKRIFGFDFESANTNDPKVKDLIIKSAGEMNIKQPADLMAIAHFYVKVTVRYKTMFHKYEHLFNDYVTSYLIDFDHGKASIIDFSYE